MDSDSPAQQAGNTWGAAPSPRWSKRQTLAAVGIAVVIGGLGGAAIFAATGGDARASGPGRHGGQWGPGGPGGPPGGPGGWQPAGPGGPGGPAGPGRAAPLHGEFVVSGETGGFVTELTQTGVVTSISATSLTAKSADGFTQTYELASGAAKGQVEVDDTVNIRATKADGKTTATFVAEGDGPAGPGGPPPMGPGGPPPR
jgi:hypothetical protein